MSGVGFFPHRLGLAAVSTSEEVWSFSFLFFFYLYVLYNQKTSSHWGVRQVSGQKQVSILCPRRTFFVHVSRCGILSEHVLLVLAEATWFFSPFIQLKA